MHMCASTPSSQVPHMLQSAMPGSHIPHHIMCSLLGCTVLGHPVCRCAASGAYSALCMGKSVVAATRKPLPRSRRPTPSSRTSPRTTTWSSRMTTERERRHARRLRATESGAGLDGGGIALPRAARASCLCLVLSAWRARLSRERLAVSVSKRSTCAPRLAQYIYTY